MQRQRSLDHSETRGIKVWSTVPKTRPPKLVPKTPKLTVPKTPKTPGRPLWGAAMRISIRLFILAFAVLSIACAGKRDPLSEQTFENMCATQSASAFYHAYGKYPDSIKSETGWGYRPNVAELTSRSLPYQYIAGPDWCVIASPGRDGQYEREALDLIYQNRERNWSISIQSAVVKISYDPTNGSRSSGDLIDVCKPPRL